MPFIPDTDIKPTSSFIPDKIRPTPSFVSDSESIQSYPNVSRIELELTKKIWEGWKSIMKPVDYPVEKVAEFIEPKPEDVRDKSKLELYGIQFPRQVAAEFVRSYKPSDLIPFVGAAKAVKPVVTPIATKAWEAMPEGTKKLLLRNITIGKGQPAAYQEIKKVTELEKLVGSREAEEAARILSTVPETGKIIKSIPNLKNSEEALRFANQTSHTLENTKILSQEIDSLSKQANELLNQGREQEYISIVSGQKQFLNEALEEIQKKPQESYSLAAVNKETQEARIIKSGKPLPPEYQYYIGRILRQDIDLGGKQSRLLQDPEAIERMMKEIEVNVAFDPRMKILNRHLIDLNRKINNIEIRTQSLVGKEFETGTLGNIEKATEISKLPKILKSGKPSEKRFDIKLKSEPIRPEKGIIPQKLFPEEDILRSVKQVSSAEEIGGKYGLPRENLLKERKSIALQIKDRIVDIETAIRAEYDIFDRTFAEQIRLHPKFQQLSQIAYQGRDIMDKWSKALMKSGIPSEEAKLTIENNIGQYMARIYKSKLAPTSAGFGFKNLRLRLNGLKHRKELSEDVLNELGEIRQPALPVALRVKEISTSIANKKLFDTVSRNPEWASTDFVPQWIKLPETKSLGNLAGKHVIPEIAEDVNQIISKENNNLVRFYKQALSAWKFGKVVLNPAAHVRNIISNTILLDLSGINHIRQAQLIPKVLDDYLKQGSIYKSALNTGAIGGEFREETIRKIRDFYINGTGSTLQRWMSIGRIPFDKVGDVYQAEEQIFKMIKFTDSLEKGLSPELAAQEAQKWLFNYLEIPRFIEFAKNISPFITFTYKAIPRIAETLVNNPLKIYKYKAFFDSWNEASRKTLDMSKEEYETELANLPDWMLKKGVGMPSNLLMPYKDQSGRTQYLNVEYILPIGLSSEILEKGILKGGFTNPFYQTVSDLQKNQDFRGKPVVPPGTSAVRANKLVAEHIYRQLMPNLAPGLPALKGGYSFEKIKDAIQKRPDWLGREREIKQVLLDTLAGIKITPVDTESNIEIKKHQRDNQIRELRRQYKSIELNKTMTEQEKDVQLNDILEAVKRIAQEE